MTYDGVVLAGGEGRRLGGVNKPALTIGGRRLLDVALSALAGATTTVAVGPKIPSVLPVVWTRESPAGGGPVAAIGAALPLLRSSLVVVLAADLPFVTSAAIQRLVSEHGAGAATVAVDDGGREQPLLACYDVAALAAAMPTAPCNASMRSLLHNIEVAGEVQRIELGNPPLTWDCDTFADLTRTQELA